MTSTSNNKFIRIDLWSAKIFFRSDVSIQAPQNTPKKLVEEHLNFVYGTGNWDVRSLNKSSVKIKREKLENEYRLLADRLQNLSMADKIHLIRSDVLAGKCPVHALFPHEADVGKIVNVQVETPDFGRLDILRTIRRITSEGLIVFDEGGVFDIDFFYSANQPHVRTSAKIRIECEVYKTVLS